MITNVLVPTWLSSKKGVSVACKKSVRQEDKKGRERKEQQGTMKSG